MNSSLKLRFENLADVSHDVIRKVVGEEFIETSRASLSPAQLKQIYRYNHTDGYIRIAGSTGSLYVFNGRAVLLLEDGRLFIAEIKKYYTLTSVR